MQLWVIDSRHAQGLIEGEDMPFRFGSVHAARQHTTPKN
jgi:hypothetical protein